eukprot:1469896-Rhodomonas_salina.1
MQPALLLVQLQQTAPERHADLLLLDADARSGWDVARDVGQPQQRDVKVVVGVRKQRRTSCLSLSLLPTCAT